MMYLSHFHLTLQPFQINTDQRFLYLSEKHQEALAILRYGVLDNRGILVLTGDVGTGKTILVHALLQSLGPEVLTAVIADPSLKGLDFFNFLAHAFGMENDFKTKGEFLIQLGSFLDRQFKTNRRVLLVIDEAQNIDPDQLEKIRILSDIERDNNQRINVFFVGQSEFNLKLADSRLRALKQRITSHYHIEPLSLKETDAYVRHRLKVAGCNRSPFKTSALKKIFELTRGYPRLINIVCDHCLLSAFAKDLSDIGPKLVKEAVADLMHPGQFSEQQPIAPENEPTLAMTTSANIQMSATAKTPPEANNQKAEQEPPVGHRKPAALFLQTVLRKPAYLLVAVVLLPALVWFGYWDDPSPGRQVSSLYPSIKMNNHTNPAVKANPSSSRNDSIQGTLPVKLPPTDRSDGMAPSENMRLQVSSPSTDHNRPMNPMAENNLNRSTDQSSSHAATGQNRSKPEPSEVGLPVRSVTATLEKRTINKGERPLSLLKLEEIAEPNQKMEAADIVDHPARLSTIPLISETDAPPLPSEKKGVTGSVDTEVTSVLPATAPKAMVAANKNRPDQATKSDDIDEAPIAPSSRSPMDTPLAESNVGELQFQDTDSDPRAIIDFVIKKRTK